MIVVAGFYALATLVLVGFGLALGVLALQARRPARPLPHAEPDAPWPHVLVQVPVYNEPPALVARALDSVAAQRYPGPVEIQLLDDSTDGSHAANATTCARLADRRLAIDHRRRPTREGFKAGALAAGLEASDAPFTAIFDADFVPHPDFLARTVPTLLADDGLAFVQARWIHPDADRTILGRIQAALLDLHFTVEQGGRDRAGWPLAFNGTAGVWRRAAIDAAGGWQGDTLAEDLDLALRARLAGWPARLLDVEAPADLPPTLDAWRTQQHRWLKGTSEVRRKLWRRVWRSSLRAPERWSASVQLAMPLTLPALLLVVLLHPILAWSHATGGGPGDAFFVALSVGYLALVGAAFAHAVTQHTRYRDRWMARTLARLPLVLAAPFALIIPGTRAALSVWAGRRSPFVRTPKADDAARLRRRGPQVRWPQVRWPEAALALYSASGALILVGLGAWAPALFQILVAINLGIVATAGRLGARRHPIALLRRALSPA